MNLWLPVLCVFLVTPFSEACDLLPGPLKIGAFYINSFGPTKIGKPEFVDVVTKILKRYDLIVVQGERDASMQTLPTLYEKLNSTAYNYTASARLGRGSYLTRYAIFYRMATVQLLDVFQYNDGPEDQSPEYNDTFYREPYAMKWKPVNGSLMSAIICFQASPDFAVEEISQLHNVTKNVTAHWPDVENILIAGNMAADCGGATETELLNAGAEVFINRLYYWTPGFDADTTTSSSDCAYDRFIAHGLDIKTALVPCSLEIFNFGQEYGLTYTEAKKISYHYPIGLTLR